MRRDDQLVDDILEAASDIARWLANHNVESFIATDQTRWAVVQRLTTIGEAANRLSESFRQKLPDTPWPQIVAFRNVLVHGYFVIRWETVWHTAVVQVPELTKRIKEAL